MIGTDAPVCARLRGCDHREGVGPRFNRSRSDAPRCRRNAATGCRWRRGTRPGLLAIAHGKAVLPGVFGNIRRAARERRHGEACLAQIDLAHSVLPPLKDETAASLRLSLGDKLLADGVTPRELIKACGLDPAALDLLKAGYDPGQPLVPAGNPDGGHWTTDDGDAPPTRPVSCRPIIPL